METAGDLAATEPEEFVPEEKKELVMAAVSRVFTCNLCKDPACPRKKGQPRQWCIHRNEAEEG